MRRLPCRSSLIPPGNASCRPPIWKIDFRRAERRAIGIGQDQPLAEIVEVIVVDQGRFVEYRLPKGRLQSAVSMSAVCGGPPAAKVIFIPFVLRCWVQSSQSGNAPSFGGACQSRRDENRDGQACRIDGESAGHRGEHDGLRWAGHDRFSSAQANASAYWPQTCGEVMSWAKVGSPALPPNRFWTEIATDLLKNSTLTSTVSVASPVAALPS